MNLLNDIEDIKKKLNEAGYDNLSNDILNAQISGGTPGEVLILVCSEILEIKKKNYKAYLTAQIEMDKLVDYAKSLNYFQ